MIVEREEKKGKYLREVMMEIGLKQEEEEEGIVVEALLDSRATRLVISEEFARKHRFRRTKLERLIYVRNVNRILNYTELIVDTVEKKETACVPDTSQIRWKNNTSRCCMRHLRLQQYPQIT